MTNTKTITIMISSTRQDLYQYREETSKIIAEIAKEKQEKIHLIEKSMEEEPQSGDRETPIDISKKWVEEADWIVLIVGFNYGTIPENQNPGKLSITEWEYRHAIESKKSIYVFLAGDIGAPDEYKISGEEKNDLKNWYFKANDDQRKGLERFRDELIRTHAEPFNNLEIFKEKLTKTLRKNIDNIADSADNSEPQNEMLSNLFVNIQDPSQECIESVKRINLYKTIHDYLHEIRYKVLRRIPIEIIPKWEIENDRLITRSLERSISRFSGTCEKFQGKIESKLPDIKDEDVAFKAQLEAVVGSNLLWDEKIDEPKLEEFEQNMEYFSGYIEDAFSEANKLMQKQNGSMKDFQKQIKFEILKYQSNNHLTPEHDQRITEQVKSISEHKEHFDNVLHTHDEWQNIHDDFEKLDKLEGKSFNKKLKYICKTRGDLFSDLIDKQFEYFNENEKMKKYLISLKENWHKIIAWKNTDALGENEFAEEIYGSVRVDFDYVFYMVDKYTLQEVGKAKECIDEFKKLLKDLYQKEEA